MSTPSEIRQRESTSTQSAYQARPMIRSCTAEATPLGTHQMPGRTTMNRHQRRLRAKAKPVRLPPPESDDYKVLRLLVAQMPMVQQAAELEQVDVLEAADGMIELIEKGLFRLLVRPDGEYELVETERKDL